MKLVELLAAGIRGAENGTVDIYARGTSTRAQLYSDYDGSGATTPSASLLLDANGGLSLNGDGGGVYVNQPVTLVARSSFGDIVRQITLFETATDVEVRSQSFTGVDYVTAASGAGKPTLLSSVLDLVKTSFGAIDFNVLAGTTTRTLSAAMSAASGLFFNVKDPAYGAVGDGITDDRSAIQAAITAANAVGGIVFLPATIGGSYFISGSLTINGAGGIFAATGVSLVITTVVPAIALTAAANSVLSIRNLRFAVNGGSSSALTIATGQTIVADGCIVSSASPATQIVLTGTARFVALGGNYSSAGQISSGGYQVFIGTSMSLTTNVTTFLLVPTKGGAFIGCSFDVLAPATLGQYISATAGGGLIVAGCSFPNPTSGTLSRAIASADVTELVEMGNFYGTTVAPINNSVPADASGGQPVFGSFEAREEFQTNDAAAVTLGQNYGNWRVRRTTNANQTLTMANPSRRGQRAYITYVNDSVGTIAVLTLTTVKGLATVAGITAGQRVTIPLIAQASSASTLLQWVWEGPAGGAAIVWS